jgi:two-component system CAI-1 autoinducer sensor kinase/phosphatase CqsS
MSLRIAHLTRNGLDQALRKNFRYAVPRLRLLATFGIVGEPFFYFYWRTVDPDATESLGIRLVAATLCVPLLLGTHRMWVRHELASSIYYAFTATFCLPFCFGYLLLVNAEHLATDALRAVQWPMQYAVALVLLVLLFPIGAVAALQFVLGCLFAGALYWFTVSDPSFSDGVIRIAVQLLPIYIFILAAGSVFNRHREIIDQEKLSAMASVGTTIAHELRTPVLGMRALVEGIEKYIPTLLRAYDLAVSNGLPVERIRLAHVRGLNRSLELIRDELDYSNSVVDMLLVNSSEQPVRESEFETFSAAECVRHAISRYAFTTEAEKALIKTELDRDFAIRAPRVLIVHVLFNLLKNALYYVRKAGRGDITISLAPGDRFNVMIVHDTGTGVPEEILDRIFERFFTTTETGQGAGIGLSFCQLVLTGIGGSIRCESALGQFTRFILEFPLAEPDD